METTAISLDHEAYALLRSKRRPGESFSQVIKRLAGNREPLANFVGAWKTMPADRFADLERERRQMRRLDDERLRRQRALQATRRRKSVRKSTGGFQT
jgi:predicted CopG family antitoxin